MAKNQKQTTQKNPPMGGPGVKMVQILMDVMKIFIK